MEIHGVSQAKQKGTVGGADGHGWVCWKVGVERSRELNDSELEKGGDSVQGNDSVQINFKRMC